MVDGLRICIRIPDVILVSVSVCMGLVQAYACFPAISDLLYAWR